MSARSARRHGRGRDHSADNRRLLQAVFFGGDFPLMPLFVGSGLLALIVGFLILGIAVLQAKVLPRWVAALLIVGVLAMLRFNEQNARVLWQHYHSESHGWL